MVFFKSKDLRHSILLFTFSRRDFAKIRIDLGNLMLKSCLEDTDKNANSVLFQVLFSLIDLLYLNFCRKDKAEERRFYMKYQLELSDLRMFYSHSSEFISLKSNNNRSILLDNQGLHVLQRTPLIDIHFYKCIYPNDIRLPK